MGFNSGFKGLSSTILTKYSDQDTGWKNRGSNPGSAK